MVTISRILVQCFSASFGSSLNELLFVILAEYGEMILLALVEKSVEIGK